MPRVDSLRRRRRRGVPPLLHLPGRDVCGRLHQLGLRLIICFTYLALWHERPDIGGWDSQDAVTFVWLGQSLLMTVAVFGGGFADELAERIRSGDIAVDLYRPIDLQAWRYAEDSAGRCSTCSGVASRRRSSARCSSTSPGPTTRSTWLWFGASWCWP